MKNNESGNKKANNKKAEVAKYIIVGILLFAMVGSMFAALISAVQ